MTTPTEENLKQEASNTEIDPAGQQPEAPPVKPWKPTSARQLAANRRNAKHSTGPTKIAGKARSSRNAVKYGIYADARPVESGYLREDPLAVATLENDIRDQLKPRNAIEHRIVSRIVTLTLQLGRHNILQTLDLEALTAAPDNAGTDGVDVFHVAFEAELLEAVTRLLRTDPNDYDPEDWEDIYLYGTRYGAQAEEDYLIGNRDVMGIGRYGEHILNSLAKIHGGVEQAADRLERLAAAMRAQLPDPGPDKEGAIEGVDALMTTRRLEAHSKIQARLQSALDRAYKNFWEQRAAATASTKPRKHSRKVASTDD